MRNYFATTVGLLSVALLFSCGKKGENTMPEAVYESERGGSVEMTQAEKIVLGDKLFRGKGTCATCHTADTKVIGPSIKDILRIYDEKGVSIVSFLKGKEDPIVEPAQFNLMEPNLQITKRMTDVELEALEAYMRSM